MLQNQFSFEQHLPKIEISLIEYTSAWLLLNFEVWNIYVSNDRRVAV